MKIILNRVKCLKCGEIIFSMYVRDYKECKCGTVAVDGGISYLKRIGCFEDMEDMSVYFENLAVFN